MSQATFLPEDIGLQQEQVDRLNAAIQAKIGIQYRYSGLSVRQYIAPSLHCYDDGLTGGFCWEMPEGLLVTKPGIPMPWPGEVTLGRDLL